MECFRHPTTIRAVVRQSLLIFLAALAVAGCSLHERKADAPKSDAVDESVTFKGETIQISERGLPVGNVVEWQDDAARVLAYVDPQGGVHCVAKDSTAYWQLVGYVRAGAPSAADTLGLEYRTAAGGQKVFEDTTRTTPKLHGHSGTVGIWDRDPKTGKQIEPRPSAKRKAASSGYQYGDSWIPVPSGSYIRDEHDISIVGWPEGCHSVPCPEHILSCLVLHLECDDPAPPRSWRTEVERNRPKPGELRRADFAYDAGGIRPRGESDGRFRIQDLQVTYQPAGPLGGVIPDTLLIVSLDRGAPVMPGRFTVVDTVFELYDPPTDLVTMQNLPARTDTTLIVRPH